MGARLPRAPGIDGQAARPADHAERPEAGHRIRREDEAEGDDRGSEGETGDRDPRARAQRDPRADDGREEVQQRRGDDERDEPDEVQPGVGGLDPRPVLDDRRPARDEERRQARTDGHFDEGRDVPLGHQSPTRPQRPTERPDRRRPRQRDPRHEPDATRHGKADLVRDDADRHGRRTEGDRTDRGRPEPRVARRRSREGRREERHHARDRRRRGTRQGQVQRQPGPSADVNRQERRDDRRNEERDRDRDGAERHQPVGRAIDRGSTATQGGGIDHGAFSISGRGRSRAWQPERGAHWYFPAVPNIRA